MVKLKIRTYPVKILFSQLIFEDKLAFPLKGTLSLFDIEFIRSFVAQCRLRILKFGQLKMDIRLQKSLSNVSEHLQYLRTCHFGLISRSFWLSQFLNRQLRSGNLEEIGWAIAGISQRIDLEAFFDNCPNAHKLYLNMRRSDIKNI